MSLLGLATPIGAILMIPFSAYISDHIFGGLLGIIAGIFFYIGAADILPRIHKVKDLICWIAFAFGLLLGSIQPH